MRADNFDEAFAIADRVHRPHDLANPRPSTLQITKANGASQIGEKHTEVR